MKSLKKSYKIFIAVGLLIALIVSCCNNKKQSTETTKEPRYKVAVCDWMILKRQKTSAFDRAVEIGCDGLEVDLGGLGKRPTFKNKFHSAIWRKEFKEKSTATGIDISSIAMSGFYAQNFAEREGIDRVIDDAVNSAELMGVNTIFLPLGVQGDLTQHPERKDSLINNLKKIGAKAEAAGLVVGIETNFDSKAEVEFLNEIASPAVKSYFNFDNAIKHQKDISDELRILGKDRIAMIHASNTDSVWLQNDPMIDMPKIKKTLDDMGWSGWLVVERSRDITQVRNVVANYGANAAYLKKIFQAE